MRALFGFPDSEAHQAGDFRIRFPPCKGGLAARARRVSRRFSETRQGGFLGSALNELDFSDIHEEVSKLN